MSEAPKTPTVEASQTEEKKESIVDIGYENLPGNFGWTDRAMTAVGGKWNGYKTWGQTLGNRILANTYEGTVASHEVSLHGHEKKRDALENKLDTISAEKDQIIDSELNRFRLVRGVNKARAGWKAWREERIKSKIRKYDQRIKRSGSLLREAQANKSVVDSRINRTVEKNTRRLDDRLRTINLHKEKSASTVTRLESVVERNEHMRESFADALEKLKERRREGRRAGGDTTQFDTKIEEVKGKIRELDRELNRGKTKLDRAYAHRTRLENAYDISETIREGIAGRYQRRIAEVARPESSSPSRESASTTPDFDGDIHASIIDLLAPNIDDTPFSPERFTQLWNTTFADAPTGSAKFLDFLKGQFAPSNPNASLESSPLYTIVQNLSGDVPFKKWADILSQLYATSPAFRSFVDTKALHAMNDSYGVPLEKNATKSTIDTLIERLRLSAAHTRTI